MPPSETGKSSVAKQTTGSRPSIAKQASGSKSSTPDAGSNEAAMQECEELEAELAALRNSFEQYFLGNERQAPMKAYEAFKKRLLKLKGGFIRGTSAKFRVQSLHAKFLTYDRLWTRTIQEIEAGTYRRDVFKARRRQEARKGSSTGAGAKKGAYELSEEISDMDIEEVDEPSRPINEPKLATDYQPTAGSTSFRGSVAPAAASSVPPGATPTKGVPAVAPVAGGTPAVAPVTIPGGTPARGAPAVAPVTVPGGVPAVAPVAGGTPVRGTPAIPPLTAPMPSGTPAKGLPTVTAPSAGGTPARATTTVPPGMAAKPVSAPPPARAAAPSAPPASAVRPPAATGSGGLSDDKLRAVYDAYVTAKRRCQEDTSKLSFDSVAATLRKQVPELLKQHNAKAVEFKVVIKDGKASLKAVPK